MTEPLPIRRTRAERFHRVILPRARRGPVSEVSISAHHVGGAPIGFAEAVKGRFEEFGVGQAWGPAWDTTWFRVRGQVPAGWSGRSVVLVVRLGGGGGTGFTAEGMVWRDGEPQQGISPNHDEIVVSSSAAGGETFELFIEAAANPRVDSRTFPPPMHMPDYGGRPTLVLEACHLAVANREVEALWEDWSLLLELVEQLPAEEARSAQILRALDRAGRALDQSDVVGSAGRARAELTSVLAKPANASAHRYAAVGNAHIDTAWLWPLRETRRKVARTFSTALNLMGEYPEYRFAASQAQQFAWLQEQYPGLFERIRKKVADGQFEPIGSMWVEADCNLPSGESLVRQVVHGKRYFAEEMGVETRALWLPDVFGYPANLPQILSLAGVRWFLTQKLSWNQWTHFPHHTFWWEGIDGSRILSHFPPADTYVGDLSVRSLAHGARNFAQKALTDRSMYLYGFGDGGGGPTRHMLERARRLADLEGAPRIEPMTSTEAFEAIEAETPVEELPVWVGELYFEMHRGTYTTHAEVKRGNRKLELALRDAELWSVVAASLGIEYPTTELDAAWKKLLLHQFHDIIPGSSIHWVYRDTAADYEELFGTTSDLIERAVAGLARSLPADPSAAGGARMLVLNPLSWARREVVDMEGTPALVEAPACGWSVQAPALEHPEVAPVVVEADRMSNGLVSVRWDEQGLIDSLVHMPTGREALPAGARANLLQLHDDHPNEYEAWDVDVEAFSSSVDLVDADSVRLIESGPLQATVEVVRQVGRSRIVQRLRLRAASPYLEIETDIDWHESHKLLKAAFPVDVHSPRASFEVQYGHLERATHANTPWEAAKYEVCAHTWADLSESGFGVAVLNDCKYGHDVRGNVIRLTLLRSPTWPDPVADQGHHHFVYAVMPHAGDLAAGGVVAAAHGLNSPLRVRTLPPTPVVADSTPGSRDPGTALAPGAASVVEVDDPDVVVSAIKRADDGEGTVVRLYEAAGGHRRARIRCCLPGPTGMQALIGSRVDLLERPLQPVVEMDGDAAVVSLHPFEIVTLVFRRP
ncbi:MAG: alpha-mannosidase [Acidimicrobiales bacterium]